MACSDGVDEEGDQPSHRFLSGAVRPPCDCKVGTDGRNRDGGLARYASEYLPPGGGEAWSAQSRVRSECIVKVFRAEFDANYGTYSFGYAVYAVPEAPEELGEVYGRGFLPYTGDLTLKTQVFYMARSLRIETELFSDSSENRRVNRKASFLEIEPTIHALADFDTSSPDFLSLCHTYAEERFSGGAMPPGRLNYVLDGNLLTHIIEFSSRTKTYGYVFAVTGADFLHYWFSFFDARYLQSHSMGKWMMWRTICLARDEGLSRVYLGTCYGSKGLYKARDHKGVAFFDGTDWNADFALLKALAHRDDEDKPRTSDLFKARQVPEIAPLFAEPLATTVGTARRQRGARLADQLKRNDCD